MNSKRLASAPAHGRMVSVDAYRGLVMLLMLAEVLRSCEVAAAVPSSYSWHLACYEQSHAAWVGASLHDLIQPSFYFLVGVGIILSMRRRLASRQARRRMVQHTFVRSVVLIVGGMALLSVHPRQWTWSFVDTLTQIGLAYPFLFLIALRPKREWYVAFAGILVGYWLWFALFPLPPAGFDYLAVGVPPEWLVDHGLTGFAAHWQKNSNAAWAFDRWFLNLFPGEAYTAAENGLTTLNFIPSIGTMILGLFAGELIRSNASDWNKVAVLSCTGISVGIAGWALGAADVVPVVKAIWTPSWVLFSGGFCFFFLALCHGFVTVAGETLVFPLSVIGMNSIVAYAMSHLYPTLAFNTIRDIVGDSIFSICGRVYEPFLYGCAILILYWLVLYALYRRRMFLRI